MQRQDIPTMSEIERVLKEEHVNDDISDADDDEDDVTEHEIADDSPLIKKQTHDTKRSKELDLLLLDFFSNSYNLPKIDVVDPLEYKKGVDDMERILDFLNVDISIPENIETNDYLDTLDVRILRSLSSRNLPEFRNTSAKEKASGIQELIPPNLYSIIGLRSLLIKHLHFNNKNRQILGYNMRNPFSQLRRFITNDILSYSVNDRQEIEEERNLFYRRFHALFKWPALLTLENPSQELLNVVKFLPKKKINQVKRTYSRGSNDVNTKQFKTTSSVTDSCKVLKLTPVSNKSIIQDLLRNKSKKLFNVSNLIENGCTKTVINEIKLDFTNLNIKLDNPVKFRGEQVSTSITLPGIDLTEKRSDKSLEPIQDGFSTSNSPTNTVEENTFEGKCIDYTN